MVDDQDLCCLNYLLHYLCCLHGIALKTIHLQIKDLGSVTDILCVFK